MDPQQVARSGEPGRHAPLNDDRDLVPYYRLAGRVVRSAMEAEGLGWLDTIDGSWWLTALNLDRGSLLRMATRPGQRWGAKPALNGHNPRWATSPES